MTILIPRTGAASAFTLAALARRYGDLPTAYVDFLAIHDGAKPPSNVLEGTNYSVSVSSFLPASEIIERANSVEGLSSELLPFGEDDSGNFVCLGAKDHCVYFWDHEIDNDRIVASGFKDFIKRLEPFDISSVRLKPGQVKSIWVNPDFKPEF